MSDVEEARRRLREWAYFFRDRATKNRTWSAEGAWRSPQCWEAEKPRPAYDLRSAVATLQILKTQIPKPNFRALTWRYCYPFLPLGIPLRSLSRRLGHRVNLKEYEELILFGEYRLAVALYNQMTTEYSAQPSGRGRRAFTVQERAGLPFPA